MIEEYDAPSLLAFVAAAASCLTKMCMKEQILVVDKLTEMLKEAFMKMLRTVLMAK